MQHHRGQQPVLFAVAPSAAATRLALGTAGALVLVAASILPFAQIELPYLPFFLPGVLTTAVMIDLAIAFLLYGQFVAAPTPAIPLLAAAFIVRSILVVGYAVASPGVILGDGHVLFGPQTASWMQVLWHLAFSALVAAYVLVAGRPRVDLPAHRKVPMLGLCLLAALAIGAGAFGAIYAARDVLPSVIVGTNYRLAITSGIAPSLLLVQAIVLLQLVLALQGRSIIRLWLSVAVLAALLHTVLISAGGARHTLGWYVAPLVGFGGAAILLAALLREMTRYYARLVAAASIAAAPETGRARIFEATDHSADAAAPACGSITSETAGPR